MQTSARPPRSDSSLGESGSESEREPAGGRVVEPEQLELVRQARRKVRTTAPKGREPLADPDPVARVVVEVSLPHLDRIFDYAVPASMAEAARPGCRVRVRFSGRLVNAYVVERRADSQHSGELARLARAPSDEVVLTPSVLRLSRVVADQYAGVLADVLRLAVPPRHARTEAMSSPVAPALSPSADESAWDDYPAGAALLGGISGERAPAAIWTATPGADWPEAIAVAVRCALAAGRGALVVLADARDVALVARAVERVCGPGQHVELTADAGPAARYRRFLAVSRGAVRCVVGTRSAQFAPVRDLGLAVLWDDGDDLHVEQRAPYPHVREVLRQRARLEHAALLIGGYAMTAEARLMVDTGEARAVAPTRATIRAKAPRVQAAGGDAEMARDPVARSARLPHLAWSTAREGLERGPVLVQVPRRGYLPALACATCREPSRCLHCAGPLALSSGHAVPHCRWCGRPAGQFQCRSCGGTHLRAQVVGARRTAEELGRAFPGVPVHTSGRDGVLDQVSAEPALVVSTPGAEPLAAGGYAAALLLDGWALLDRPDLRANEEALRRWFAAAALVQPAAVGGRVIVMADSGHRAVQGLIRWDPSGSADRELADRRALNFPPLTCLAELSGLPEAVAELVSDATFPSGADLLGPQPLSGDDGRVRLLVRVTREDASALAAALATVQSGRSARKATSAVRVCIDPVEVG